MSIDTKHYSNKVSVSVISNIFSNVDVTNTTFLSKTNKTIETLHRELLLDRKVTPLVCCVDGNWLLQSDWNTYKVKSCKSIAFMVLPEGGGSGGNKDILRGVLMVAVVVASFTVAPGLALGLGLGTSGLAIALTQTALSLGGTLLINAVVPQTTSASNSVGVAQSVDNPSTNYSLRAQGNQAKLEQVIPVLYGEMRIYPDYAASPWVEYVNGSQYLNQLFVLTQGECSISQVYLGDTIIESFQDQSYQIIPPNNQVTLFNTNVYTAQEISGQTLIAPNEVTSGDGWLGPFPACPANQTITSITVDLSWPLGLIATNLNTGNAITTTSSVSIVIRQIDEYGIGIGVDILLDVIQKTAGITKPINESYTYTTPFEGRWSIKVIRNSNKDLINTSVRDTVLWSALKGNVSGTIDFGNVTLLAVRLKANDTLNSSTSSKLSVVAKRKLPIRIGENQWTGDIETNSIVWAISDILRNTTYGGGMDEKYIDFDTLSTFDAILQSRGDTFNAIFDNQTSVWQALDIVSRVGRIKPYHQFGIIKFHRDQSSPVPLMAFTSDNIVKDSFVLQYVFAPQFNKKDGVRGIVLDKNGWVKKSISKNHLNQTPSVPADINFFGITDFDQAEREAYYHAARNHFGRISISFDTELEGLLPVYGTTILVAVDTIDWGQSGVIKSWDESNLELTWSETAYPFDTLSGMVFRIQDKMGVLSKEIPVVSYNGQVLTLGEIPTYTDTTVFDMDSIYGTNYLISSLGTVNNKPRLATVIGYIPKGNSKVGISCVLYDERVFVN